MEAPGSELGTMPMSPLAVQLFGPMRVLIHGEPVPPQRTRSVEWLLALLVLRNGRNVERSWLTSILWPDTEETAALHNLRNNLVMLRKALGPEQERLQSPSRATLTLNLEGADVDTLHFDRAIRAGTEAALREAVDLYTGPLLEGCHEEWVFTERDSRAQVCLRALEQVTEFAEARGEYTQALTLLRRAEKMDPLQDSIQRGLMRVQAASGDIPAALISYRDYRLRLRQEANLEPDVETQRLYQEIREQGAPLPRVKDAPVTPKAPIRTEATPGRPATLPHPLTTLIGRQQEIREITATFAGTRLLTLVGGGGVGKTRLSIQAAHELAAGFAEGAVFVALASLSDSSLLHAFVAEALGIREEATTEAISLLQALIGWLATHEVLLVLDNCEHLVEATAMLAQTLLERCPNLRILATSRQRLGLTGEVVWRVPSLPFPDPSDLSLATPDLEVSVQQYPAVQLFIERASMVRAGFRLSGPDDALAVAEICQRLDGIPLAIELAAARVGMLPVRQVAARLGDRFRLLTGGSRGDLTRHQTLRALIDWSYDLLNPSERTLLCRLAVFSGGWTLTSAEAIARRDKETEFDTDVLDTLSSLNDKSLIHYDEKHGDFRYRMLETVREYLLEKQRSCGEDDTIRDRHLDWFLEQARTCYPALLGANPEPALGFLESEIDNLRAALNRAQSKAPGSPTAYLELVSALWPFWELHGHTTEGRTHLHIALPMSASVDTALRAQILLGAARLAVQQSDLAEVEAYGQECLALFKKLGNSLGMAQAMYALSEIEHITRGPGRAVPFYRTTLTYCRQAQWSVGIATALIQLGLVTADEHDENEGRSLMEEGLTLAESLENPRIIAQACRNLGVQGTRLGQPERARALLERSLLLRRRLGDRLGTANSLGCLAQLELRLGEMGRAQAWCEEECRLFRELGSRGGVAHALHRLGNILYLQGNYVAACPVYEECLSIFTEFKSDRIFNYVRLNVACTRFHLGDSEAAKTLHHKALTIYVEVNLQEGIVWTLERIGIVEASYGDSARAAQLMGAASILRDVLGKPRARWDQIDWDNALARLCMVLGESNLAETLGAGQMLAQEQVVSLALEAMADVGLSRVSRT